MSEETGTRREILSAREVKLVDLPNPERRLVLTLLNAADWGRGDKVSITQILCAHEQEPRFLIDSWAPTEVIPAGGLVESEEDEILDWVNQNRGVLGPQVLETVYVLPAQERERDFLGMEPGTPVLIVWRIAYDHHDRPFLAQREILRPCHILSYARWVPFEKTLARRGGLPGGRTGAAA